MSLFARDCKIPMALLIAGLASLVTFPAFANYYLIPADSSSDVVAVNQLNAFFVKFDPRRAHLILQAGGFSASQGSAQNIGIDGLLGDYFTLTQRTDQNVILGLGYFANGSETSRYSLWYGLNAFYLANTTVQGNIVQEQLFTNLSYQYSITNFPIYAAVKALIKTDSNKYTITLDLGIGPNIISTSNFEESSLDGGITIPDNAFSGQTSAAFSAMLGIGIKFNNVLGKYPVEVGYRFFYLGQANLNQVNSQLTSTLNTGNSYANALTLSIST